jgi:hypothetical protein
MNLQLVWACLRAPSIAVLDTPITTSQLANGGARFNTALPRSSLETLCRSAGGPRSRPAKPFSIHLSSVFSSEAASPSCTLQPTPSTIC